MSKIDTQNRPLNRGFEFSGKGTEYFSIWVVNVVLTILTLGIYSAWAKVRTKQYFYGNTKLDGVSFQYLADPKRILIGRVLASIIFVGYYGAAMFSPTTAVFILLALLALGPVFLVWSMSFQLRNSAYRHVSFVFQKDYLDAYKTFALPILVIGSFMLVSNLYLPEELKVQDIQTSSMNTSYAATDDLSYEGSETDNTKSLILNSETIELDDTEEATPISPKLKIYLAVQLAFMLLLILFTPLWDYWITRYRATHSQYGTEQFCFDVKARQFYNVYGRLFLMSFLVMLVIGTLVGVITPILKDLFGVQMNEEVPKMLASLIMALSALLFVPAYLWFFAYFKAKRTNLIYSHLDLNGNQLKCNMKTGYLMYLYLTNTLAMAMTLGLLMPWAMVRTARYRASVSSLETNGPLQQFTAIPQKQQGALGEELGGMFDLELGI